MLKKTFKLLGWIGTILTGFYVFASAPGLHRKSKWQHLLGWDYAHRGLHNNDGGIPENSMAAFKQAVEHGYGIELDVHLTADNQLVVFHDDSLLRVCGRNEKLNKLPLSELEQAHLLHTNEHIPMFKDVLNLVNGQVPLIIELKVDDRNHQMLCTLVWQLLKDYQGDYCIESFHPFAVRWFRFHQPQVVRGQLSCDFFKENPHCNLVLFLVANLMTNFLTHPDFVAYKYLDIKNPAFKLNQKLFRIMTVVWTIKSKPAYDHYKNQIDAIIFEGFEP